MDRSCDNIIGYVDRHSLKQQYRKQRDSNRDARWLTENPVQDPVSDYGRQKRGVRRLLKEFWLNGGDPRWAVLPGVLHSEATWGKGTTEYALEALLAAVKKQ